MGLLIDNLWLLMFLMTCAILLAGYPVAFALSGSALLFALIATAVGVFDLSYLEFLPQRIFGTMTNEVLIAVPLFVFMGVMLERSRVAEELLSTMGELLGRVRGGLSIAVVLVGAMLAASTGIVGATVVTLGLLALPTMLRTGYDHSIATGTVAASGTLGQIIPPSIVLILLGDVISTAYQESQLEAGIFSPETVSVGDLFAGALVPGLVLVLIYVGYLFARAVFAPDKAPPVTAPAESTEPLGIRVLRALVPPVVLIVAVLGSILGGVATATEAAAVGAIGATLLAGRQPGREGEPASQSPVIAAALGLVLLVALTVSLDLRLGREEVSPVETGGILLAFAACLAILWGTTVSLLRAWRRSVLTEVMRSTAEISAMVFTILIGAAVFTLVFRGLGGDEAVEGYLTAMPGGVVGAMITVMVIMFLLGFFLDFIEITFVVVPIVAPILLGMGLDPVWLGVMMAMNLQTSFLTPPFGFALFYLRGVAPENVATGSIYKGALPFVGLQIGMLGLVALFPQLATALPDALGR